MDKFIPITFLSYKLKIEWKVIYFFVSDLFFVFSFVQVGVVWMADSEQYRGEGAVFSSICVSGIQLNA